MITEARKKDLAQIVDALEMIINHVDGGMEALGDACGLSVSEYSQVEDAIFDNGVFYERVDGEAVECMDKISKVLSNTVGYEYQVWLALYNYLELEFFREAAMDAGMPKKLEDLEESVEDREWLYGE